MTSDGKALRWPVREAPMPDASIRSVSTYDARFPLPPGAGTDSVHTNSEYSFAVTSLAGENGLRGTGIATSSCARRLRCSPSLSRALLLKRSWQTLGVSLGNWQTIHRSAGLDLTRVSSTLRWLPSPTLVSTFWPK